MKIALVSLDQVWEDKEANQIKCSEYIEKASLQNAELIVFPEMTLTGFSMNTKLIREDPNHSISVEFFTHQALRYNISIVFGVVFRKQDKATNNCIVIDNNGQIIATYAKIHPFSYSGENNYYLAGEELITCQISNATIGLTICYDLRFPEIFQILSKSCNMIITTSNWPEKRIKHWNTLLQARAIENQSFILGVNRIGLDGNSINYIKSSAVYNPNGEIIDAIDSYLNMEIYDINLDDVINLRKLFPVKQDRRNELYKLNL